MPSLTTIRALTVVLSLAAARGSEAPDSKAQAQALTEFAERDYRLSEFERARNLFSAALTHSPGYIPAALGLVRLDILESYRKRAWDRVQQLADAHPGDPQVANAQHLMRELQLARETLRSPYQRYSIPLRIDQRGAEPEGVYVTASVNGSRPLRLLVDTGASRILLNPKVAASLNLQPIQSGSIGGYGDGSQSATIALARSLRLGMLEFSEVRTYVSNMKFENGIDGLIGTRLFGEFLLNLNVPGKRLDLEPFANADLAGESADTAWMDWNREAGWVERGFDPLYQLGHYLLVKGRFTAHRAGVFLLDTGAGFNALDEDGEAPGSHLFSPVGYEVSGLNLKPWSAHNGVKLDGVLGFPAVRYGVLTLNYRDGYWKLSR